MKKLTKKFIALFLIILTLANCLPLQAFATFITDINSNATFGVISGSYANYGHELHYADYDGTTYMMFCTQYGTTSPGGSEYVYNESFIAQYKSNLPAYEKIAEMIYFGYTMNYGMGIPTSTEAIRAACCTQQYVWEYIHNYIDSSFSVPSRDSWNSNYMSSSYYALWLLEAEANYNTYNGDVSFIGTTTNVTIGKSATITDVTTRLSAYQTFSQEINGITFSHVQGSNDLTITVSSDCTADSVTFNTSDYGIYQLLPSGAEYSNSTMSNYVYIQFTSGSIQNLLFSNYVNPRSFSINVEVGSGNLLIVKTNANGDTVANCGFEIYSDANCTQLVESGVSDSNGQINFTRLSTGDYYVKEVSVPTGYLLDTTVQKVTVKSGETAEVIFKNNEPTGKITLTKTDTETGNSNRVDETSHHGDATLSGAIYTLYANEDIYNTAKTIKYFSKGDVVATYTFNEYGKATVEIINTTTSANLTASGDSLTGLPMGSYYAYETSVPIGYMQDTNTYTYTLNYKDMYTSNITVSGEVKNTVQKAKFEVIKISSNTNEIADVIEGAEFTAILTKYVDYYGSFDEALNHLNEYATDEYSVFTTGSDGHGISGYLAYGNYTINETVTPEGVNKVKEFYVTINKNSSEVIKELVANDTPFESYIKIIKKDKETGKEVTYSSATFSLFKLNETTKDWEEVACKSGETTYSTWTTNEEGYAVTESKLTSGTYKIKEIIAPDGYIINEEEIIFEVNSKNESLEYDEDFDAWITVVVENEQPTGSLELTKTVNLSSGADISLINEIDYTKIYFQLVAKEDVIDYADGSTIFEKGEEIGIYNLDENGSLIIEDIPLGKYYIQEIETLDGLVIDEEKYDIIVEQEDDTTEKYVFYLDIDNFATLVEFSKTDITGDEELVGASLQVLDLEGNIIDEWISQEKAHKIEGLSVGETYILHEDIAIEGYVKASDVEFTVENFEGIQIVTMIDKVVSVLKVDSETGEALEEAMLEVVDKNGIVIDNWISTSQAHCVKNLEEGERYTLIEVRAPKGYEISENIEFTVSLSKETQVIKMKDNLIVEEVEEPKEEKIEEPEKEKVEEPTQEEIPEEPAQETEEPEPEKVVQTGKDDDFWNAETTLAALIGLLISVDSIKKELKVKNKKS